jgi:enoyl-CoA hydratase
MIHVELRPPVRILRLEHGKVQAIDLELLRELDDALARAEEDTTGAVVLTGTGTSFSAGVNLFRLCEGGAAYAREFLPLLSSVLLRAFAFPRPMVAAVNGHAIAGGAILAWCADIRVMAAGTARIGIPELKVGVPFPAAPLEIARLAAGPHFGRLAFLGETLLPEDALPRRLVDEVVLPHVLIDRAVDLASQMAAMRSAAFRLTKANHRKASLYAAARLAKESDDLALREWCDPDTHARIRAYLDQTVGRSRT